MPDPGFKIPNGGMATHLVAKRCDLGSLGVPGPASTPLGRRGRATSSIDPKLDLDLDISDLGFDQISTYKRGGWRTPHLFLSFEGEGGSVRVGGRPGVETPYYTQLPRVQ